MTSIYLFTENYSKKKVLLNPVASKKKKKSKSHVLSVSSIVALWECSTRNSERYSFAIHALKTSGMRL
jgi:hypothetical protein